MPGVQKRYNLSIHAHRGSGGAQKAQADTLHGVVAAARSQAPVCLQQRDAQAADLAY